MKLSRRLILSNSIALLLVAAAGLVGVQQMGQAVTRFDRTIANEVAQQRQTLQMLATFKVQVQEWKNVLLRGKDPQALDKHWKAFGKEEQAVAAQAKALAEALPAGADRNLVLQFAQAHAAMAGSYRKGLAAFEASGFDPRAGDLAVKGVDRAPAELLDQAVEATEGRMLAEVEAAHSTTRRATIGSVAAMLLTLLACGIGGWWLARAIARPLEDAVEVAGAVAQGDLTRSVRARGDDEVRQLLQALADMTARLTGLVTTVRQSSDSIATGSGQIAAGSNDLSRRTETQAGSLQQTAASMEQLNDTVSHSAGTAHQASQLAQAASGAAARGGEVVAQVVSTMDEISESSQRIADIVGVIDGIAFQTNILALNAAVEAARAGEEGRGFAVVASEVRALAQRSASAAREIKSLIATSVERVEVGSQRVSEAGRSMNEIVDQVRRVSQLIGEISAAASEQTSGIGQINAAVTQLDQATQQNSALVEQSTAAAHNLQQQAQALVQAVQAFKVQPG